MQHSKYRLATENDFCHQIICEINYHTLNRSADKLALPQDYKENYKKVMKLTGNDRGEKKPEIINIDSEDEDIPLIVLDSTVEEIDCQECGSKDVKGMSLQESVKLTNNVHMGCIEDIIIIDSGVEQLNHNSVHKDVTQSVLKESNNQGVKRKKTLNKTDNKLELIEDMDDDVIVLDDSISIPNCSVHPSIIGSCDSSQMMSDLKVTLIGDSRIISDEPVRNSFNSNKYSINKNTSANRNKNKILNDLIGSESCHSSLPPSKKCKLAIDHLYNSNEAFKEKDKKINDTLFTANNKAQLLIDLSEDKISAVSSDLYSKTDSVTKTASKSSISDILTYPSSTLQKKVSKLTYKRPAHLVKPLTKSSSSDTSNADLQNNIYNPNAFVAGARTGLRPIVIDGNNVGVSHGKGQFSVKGVQVCVNFFEKRGHRQIKAFVPHYRKNRDTFEALNKMEQQGTVVFTPSRKVDGKVVASYDDRYIVQYASEFGGVIVSTDNYRDLLQENTSWKETIENRLLMFTWVDDLLMFPQDPLGRNGPSLDDFLKFPD